MEENDSMTDAALARKAKDGDPDAFRVLFERYATMVRGRIHRLLSPAIQRKVSISDVVQEACLVAAQRIDDFEDRGEGSFGRWFVGIAENRARKAAEQFAGTAKRDLRREVTRCGRPETHQFQGRGPSPSQLAIARELREAAARALRQLPEDYREVLRLIRDEDRSAAEAARILGRSPDATRMLYGRALGRFASLLKQERGEPHEP